MPSKHPNPLEPFLNPSPVLIIITGPSGVGKDSVIDEMKKLDDSFHFVVTATDRGKRDNEIHGVDYLFVSTAEFERMIAENELFEHARVYDQYKGVPKAHVRQAMAAGQDAVMRVDVQGAQTMQEQVPGSVIVFLAPPSVEILAERLHGRGTDTATQIEIRLDIARQEIALAETFDYVVVNWEDELTEAAQQILAIMEAEKHRTQRHPVEL